MVGSTEVGGSAVGISGRGANEGWVASAVITDGRVLILSKDKVAVGSTFVVRLLEYHITPPAISRTATSNILATRQGVFVRFF